MKPFLLVTGDFIKTGGMDQCNHELALFLANRGVETHLVAHRVDPQLAAHPNVAVHIVGRPLNSYFLGRPFLDLRGRQEAARISGRGGRVVVNGGNCIWPDINWTHHLHRRYKPDASAGALRRLKIDLEFRQAAAAERRALKCAKLVIAVSDAIRRELIEDFGIPEKIIHKVDLGVDPAMFRLPAPAEREKARAALDLPREGIAAAFVGAIGDRRKGFDTAYLAWKTLCESPDWDANAQLIVVGAGFELPIWRKRALADGLDGRIRFLGFNPAPDFVVSVLRACDLILAPSRYEGYGLAIQEAVCTGLPAIVSRLAPVTDRFEGYLAELMIPDPDDVAAVVDRLRLWRSRRAEFAHQAMRLSDRLRKWTWTDMASQFLQIVEPGATAL